MVDKSEWLDDLNLEHTFKIPGSGLKLSGEFSMVAMDIVDGLFFKSNKDRYVRTIKKYRYVIRMLSYMFRNVISNIDISI